MLLFIAPISNTFPIHVYNQGVLLIFLAYEITFFFCYCNCYCSRMPKAWESAHFIIQRLPLLSFCFLQYPLPLKAKDYFNAFLPTGRVEYTVSPEAMVHNTLYICLLQYWRVGTFCCRPRGLISMTSSMAVHKAKILKFLAKLHFSYVSAWGCMIISLHYLPAWSTPV